MNGENSGGYLYFPQNSSFAFLIFAFSLNIQMYLTPLSKVEKSIFLCETLYHKMNSNAIKNSTLNTVM